MLNEYKVIYKEIWVPIMMIEHIIFTRSNTILSDQNACLLSYNIMKESLVKILLDQDQDIFRITSWIEILQKLEIWNPFIYGRMHQ